jgi:cytochrome c553
MPPRAPRSRRFAGWLSGALAIAAAIALARPPRVYAGGDPAAGKDRSLTCAACHVTSDPASDAPRLAGQGEGYLHRELAAFKRGDRANPYMSSITRQLSEADIANLAAFWSRQPAGADATATPPPAAVVAIRRSHMAFPAGFPGGFVLYLTSNVAEQNIIRKTYINAIGFQAARASRPLPDGTIILVVIYAAKLDAAGAPVLARDGSWVIGKLVSYSGMEARAGWGKDIPELLRNANWNYSLFTASKAPVADGNQALCMACHKPQAAVSYVFTSNELRDKASTP